MKEQLITFETAKLAKEKGFVMFDKNFKSALVDTRNNRVQRYSFYREFNENCYTRERYPMSIDEPRVQFQFEAETNSTNIYGLRSSYECPNDKDISVHCFLAPTQSLLQKWLREEHKISLVIIDTRFGQYWYRLDATDGAGQHNKYDDYEEALEKGLQEALKLIKQ